MPETASVTTAAVAVDISEVSAENAHQNIHTVCAHQHTPTGIREKKKESIL